MSVPYFTVRAGHGHQPVIHPGNSPLRFLEVDRLTLTAGDRWRRPADNREAVIVPLAGQGRVAVESGARDWRGEIRRNDLFAGPPSTAYVPSRSGFTVEATAPLEAVVVSAPSDGVGGDPLVLPPGEVAVATVGREFWQREVRTIFGPEGATARLLVGETITPPGHWSGMPPHKHDVAAAEESLLEEVYYYRLSPPDGFLVQLFYDQQGWHAEQVVREEGAAAITRGYHPTVAASSTTGYYLWALAGPEKSYKVSIDPVFDWMRSVSRS